MDKSNTYFTECNVLILGPLNLQNEFLHYVINREIKASCTIYDQDITSFPECLDIDLIDINDSPAKRVGIPKT